MLSAGGQCGRCGISLNHRCDPEEQWKHDPWNYAHSSNEAELTFPPPFNTGWLSTNLRLSVKSTSGGRIFDGVGILHNFLEIFSFSRITRERAGVYKKMGGKAMPKITLLRVLLALTFPLRRGGWSENRSIAASPAGRPRCLRRPSAASHTQAPKHSRHRSRGPSSNHE